MIVIPLWQHGDDKMTRIGHTRLFTTFLLIALIAVLTGCARISGRLAAPDPPEPTGTFKAGAARVDITPMPGYPMGGMSVAGRISRGTWTRLYARAVCFEDRGGRSLALVSADLWSISAGLADRVADILANEYGVRRLGREQIVLAATHTHHSPANYSSSRMYNQLASIESGFDQELFSFLAHRIASAIAEAWENRRPAVLRYGEMPLTGVARNRSLEPFLANGAPAQALIEANMRHPLRISPFLAEETTYRAVDQTLRVIRAEATDEPSEIIAALAFYAVHPTIMGPAMEVYSSDLFGVAAMEAERRLGARGKPVVAIFNGAEGDVSSNWIHQDREEVLALGGMLSDGILTLLELPGEAIDGPIAARFGAVDLSSLAAPATGASQLAGSEGDWTFFRDAGFHEGMTEDDPKHMIDGHGPKRHLLADDIESKVVQGLLPLITEHILQPPTSPPVGVYRVGSVVLATLPGEFTTMAGRLIAEAIKDEVPGTRQVLMVGLANEYLSYFVTEQEYALQHYEGASTIYGPRAFDRVRSALVELASLLDNDARRKEPLKYRYSPGPRQRFGVDAFGFLSHQDRLSSTYVTLANVLMDRELSIPDPTVPFFVWIDREPAWPDDHSKTFRGAPSVSIERLAEDKWVPLEVAGLTETDEGANFVTIVVGSLFDKVRWATYWMPPDEIEADPSIRSAELRFVVDGVDGTFHSPAFKLADVRREWGFTGIARHPAAD